MRCDSLLLWSSLACLSRSKRGIKRWSIFAFFPPDIIQRRRLVPIAPSQVRRQELLDQKSSSKREVVVLRSRLELAGISVRTTSITIQNEPNTVVHGDASRLTSLVWPVIFTCSAYRAVRALSAVPTTSVDASCVLPLWATPGVCELWLS